MNRLIGELAEALSGLQQTAQSKPAVTEPTDKMAAAKPSVSPPRPMPARRDVALVVGNSNYVAFFTHISHYARAREARRSALPGGGNFFFSYLLEVWGQLALLAGSADRVA